MRASRMRLCEPELMIEVQESCVRLRPVFVDTLKQAEANSQRTRDPIEHVYVYVYS